MLPFRHVGQHDAGQWTGLIDAVYGIAMTLMIFNLPKTLKDIARQYAHHPEDIKFQTFDFAIHIVDYLLVFLILYEIWCFHKTILLASSNPPHRLHGHITAIILALASVSPAYTVFLLDEEGHELLSSAGPSLAYLQLRSSAFYLFLLAAIGYAMLALLARVNANHGNRQLLKLCSRSSSWRCLIFSSFFISSFAAYKLSYFWLRPNILIIAYLAISFHQDHVFSWINRRAQLQRNATRPSKKS